MKKTITEEKQRILEIMNSQPHIINEDVWYGSHTYGKYEPCHKDASSAVFEIEQYFEYNKGASFATYDKWFKEDMKKAREIKPGDKGMNGDISGRTSRGRTVDGKWEIWFNKEKELYCVHIYVDDGDYRDRD